MHEKPEEKDDASSSSFTYHTRQPSTKTEAVLQYVDFPMLNQLVQFVTPLSNTGPLKPEQRDVVTYTNLEGRYDDEEAVEKQLDEQPEQGDMMVDITLDGEQDEKKNVGRLTLPHQPEDDEREGIHHRLREGHREPQGKDGHGCSTYEGGRQWPPLLADPGT
jgi:hypothetical protein